MTSSQLESRYRVVFASFSDSDAGQSWQRSMGGEFRTVADALIQNFGTDLALLPDDVHQEHVSSLVQEYLPARLPDKMVHEGKVCELVLEFLLHLGREEGLARDWEWTSAVDSSRAAFATAMSESARPRFQAAKSEPHKRPGSKLGRNDPCPCGSGKKYKRCCAG